MGPGTSDTAVLGRVLTGLGIPGDDLGEMVRDGCLSDLGGVAKDKERWGSS